MFLFQVKNSMRGCIRGMNVNKNKDILKGASLTQGLGQCFTNVQAGAHFTGNSYGVYSKYGLKVLSEVFSIWIL